MAKFRVSGTMKIAFETEVEAEDQYEAEEIIEEMDHDRLLDVADKVTFDFDSTDEIG